MRRNQKRLILATSIISLALLSACGTSTNPISNYSNLVAQSVPVGQGRAGSDQYLSGSGFAIQIQGHGDSSDMHFTSGQASTYTIQFLKPVATPGVDLELVAVGPAGSHFSKDAGQASMQADTYTFTWTPPAAGRNTVGKSQTLYITLKKSGREAQLDPSVKTLLDKGVSQVAFNLLVDAAGKVFDVAVQWPANAPIIQEGTSVQFNVVVTDETAANGTKPHLEIGKVEVGNEVNAEDGSSFVTCGDDSQAVAQGTQWFYTCTFTVKSGAAIKQASANKTEQYVAGQAVVGYSVSAKSADGLQKAKFNDRRTVVLNAPATTPAEKKR